MHGAGPAINCERCGIALGQGEPECLWDGRRLCCNCFTSEFAAEFDDLALNPQESVSIGLGEALLRGIKCALIANTIFAGMLLVLFLLIRFSFQMAQLGAGKQFAAAEPLTWLIFLVSAWAFTGIVVIPLVIGCSLASRSRNIHVDDGRLIHSTGLRTIAIPLAECVWYELPTGFEGARLLFWGRPLIGVNHRQNPQQSLVCGFTDRSRRLWAGYFTRTLHSAVPGIRKMRVVLGCLRGLVIGGAGGMAIGGIFNLATGDSGWITPLTFIGFLDGLLWGFCDALFKSATAPKFKTPYELNQSLMAVSIIGAAALLGVQLGLLAGIPGAVGCGIGNGAVGAVGWLWIRSNSRRLMNSSRAG